MVGRAFGGTGAPWPNFDGQGLEQETGKFVFGRSELEGLVALVKTGCSCCGWSRIYWRHSNLLSTRSRLRGAGRSEKEFVGQMSSYIILHWASVLKLANSSTWCVPGNLGPVSSIHSSGTSSSPI